jgi:hypothetical protein
MPAVPRSALWLLAVEQRSNPAAAIAATASGGTPYSG